MDGRLLTLDSIKIAAPCNVPWESMCGDDRVRFCGKCQLNVYNLSGMTRSEAEALINEQERRVCVSMIKRADGTVLTQDCPVGLRAIRQRIARIKAIAAALLAFLTFGTLLSGCCLRTQGAVDVAPRTPMSLDPKPPSTDSRVPNSSSPAATKPTDDGNSQP